MPDSYVPDMGGYYHAMDRQYDKGPTIPMRELGIPTPPFGNQLDGLKAKIFQGASKVELGFSGAGKGSMQGQRTTPEMYGKDEREDIRALAKINKVELSTHASFSIGSLAGFGEGGFDEDARKSALDEVRRTVEFAADTARGGAIVVHAQEFPRGIIDEYGADFATNPFEAGKGKVHFVNTNTGKLQVLSKDQEIPIPKMRDEIDPITGKATGIKVPVMKTEIDSITGREARVPVIEFKKWGDFVKEAKEKGIKDDKLPNYFYSEYLGSQERQAKGWMGTYEERIRDIDKKLMSTEQLIRTAPQRREELRKAFEAAQDPREKREWQMEMDELERNLRGAPEARKELFQEKEKNYDGYVSYREQVLQFNRMKKEFVPIKDYGVQKTAETIAESAIYAWQLEEQSARQGKPFERKMYIAPENLFPENYGSHPSEMREVVLTSRKKIIQLLTQEKIEVVDPVNNKKSYYDNPYFRSDVSTEEAGKIANDHVKATLDTGHAYMWKRFFLPHKGENPEQTEKRFNDWVVDQVGMLVKDDIIGNVHLHDNFGYYDEHVTPGQGKIPLKRIVEKLKAGGVKDIIVEPAHQDYKALMGAWREFGHSIYGIAAPGMPRDRWTDIEFGYFGKNAPPYFVVGDFRPSDEWTLWSQTPME